MSYQKHNFEAGAVLFASQLNDMDNQIEVLSNQESTLSDNFKVALLNCFENVAWVNQNGQSYYNELYNALYPDIFWTVTNTLSGCTNSNNTTNVLKNSSYVATITANQGYTLDGATINILMGGNDVTNLYYSSGSINIPNVTGDLVISVTAVSAVVSISAVFTQGSATIYDTDTLDTLRQYLTVTATYSDSTTAVVTDYTLSGTLEVGTSTITVSYGGKTDTFSVTITSHVLYIMENTSVSTGDYILTPASDIKPISAVYDTVITLDCTFSSLPTSGNGSTVAILAGWAADLNSWGIRIGKTTGSSNTLTGRWMTDKSTVNMGFGNLEVNTRNRFAIVHEANSKTVTVYYKKGNGTKATWTRTATNFEQLNYISLGSQTNGASSMCAGTVALFKVSVGISSAELDAFFA